MNRVQVQAEVLDQWTLNFTSEIIAEIRAQALYYSDTYALADMINNFPSSIARRYESRHNEVDAAIIKAINNLWNHKTKVFLSKKLKEFRALRESLPDVQS